jgi:hypothetical protein
MFLLHNWVPQEKMFTLLKDSGVRHHACLLSTVPDTQIILKERLRISQMLPFINQELRSL